MPVDFDLQRMQKALQSERFVVSQGLTPEQILEHIINNAKEYETVEMPSGLSLEEKREHILATARKYRESLS